MINCKECNKSIDEMNSHCFSHDEAKKFCSVDCLASYYCEQYLMYIRYMEDMAEIEELNLVLGTENDRLKEKIEDIEANFDAELDELKAECATLREQLRWRIVANGELPKEMDVVIGCSVIGCNPGIVYTDNVCMLDGTWLWASEYDTRKGDEITHWMPLPEPPEVKG